MLNEQQQAAVNHINGQLLIIACPGSGKTTVIVDRANHMVESGINPANILVITFTNQAANQMKDRYQKKYGETQILFGTIHSLCFRVVSKLYGYRREDILSPAEQRNFFYEQVSEQKMKISDIDAFIKGILSEISYVRNREIDPKKFKSDACEDEKMFYVLYEAYENFKSKLTKVDFDDMIVSCRHIFETMPDELAYWRKQFPYIMIDEYQDTNTIQADIFYMLAGDNGNICVVGDDDQSIYKFRAADSSIMLGFPRKYENCTQIRLTTNYRSQPVIVKHASMLIKNNRKRFTKEFLAARDSENGRVVATALENETDEALNIVKMIEAYHKAGVPYNEMAVLYRNNAQNQLLLGKLMKAEIPFYTTEAPRDYHNEFIFGDIMAYARLSSGNWKKGDVQRILNRPGRYLKAEPFKDIPFEKKAFFEACKKFPAEQIARAKVIIAEMFADIYDMANIKTPTLFVKRLGFTLGYKNWLKSYATFLRKDPDILLEIFNTLLEESKGFSSMEEWAEYARFYAEQLEKKRKETKKEGVCLSTFHSSKGLEWKVVFILDANEGITPSQKAETDEDYEEERRAFYVAVTRAKDILHILYTKSNGEKEKAASRYIAEMQLTR